MEEKAQARRSMLSVLALSLATAVLAGVLWSASRSPAAPTPSPSAQPAVSAAPSPNPTEAPGVLISRRYYSRNKTTRLTLKGEEITANELREILGILTNVEYIELPDSRIGYFDQTALMREFPDVVFDWPVRICGRAFNSLDEEISFAGQQGLYKYSLVMMQLRADAFYNLRSIDLTGCGYENEELHALDAALGDGIDVVWTIDLYGVEVCSTAEEIDLSDHLVTDKGAQVEAALPWFSHLKKVVMCNCGVSNEDMDALNNRHEDVRFVWMVDIQWAAIRTDSDFFIPYRSSGVKQTRRRAGLKNLVYCTDLIALDIGHAHTQDISYISVMPHLKYLIIAENYVVDISVLEDLKELKWLEMFQCVTRDLSPLLGCTALEDLNICYLVAPRDNVFETLRQMTWLKRLWCSGSTMTKDQVRQLREALPDTEIWCRMGDESTGSTWRYSESYYEMRDAFHMYYMDITGNRVRRLTAEELQRMHDRFWPK